MKEQGHNLFVNILQVERLREISFLLTLILLLTYTDDYLSSILYLDYIPEGSSLPTIR